MLTVVITNLNKGPFVAETIDSLLRQTMRPEIIFVDDASTDGSLELARERLSGVASARVIVNARSMGQPYCENRGIAASTCSHIMFLDSDDLLTERCCEDRLAFAEANPGYDLWVSPMAVFGEDPSKPYDEWRPSGGDFLRGMLSHRLPWSIMQPLWRKEFVISIGGFDESFERLVDPSFHARALIAGARVKCRTEGPADCLYRVTLDRHHFGAEALARRHVRASIHFYRTFAQSVSPGHRRATLGTLHAAMLRIAAWHHLGRIPDGVFAELSDDLIRATPGIWNKAVLRATSLAHTTTGRYVPGSGRIGRMLLGI